MFLFEFFSSIYDACICLKKIENMNNVRRKGQTTPSQLSRNFQFPQFSSFQCVRKTLSCLCIQKYHVLVSKDNEQYKIFLVLGLLVNKNLKKVVLNFLNFLVWPPKYDSSLHPGIYVSYLVVLWSNSYISGKDLIKLSY